MHPKSLLLKGCQREEGTNWLPTAFENRTRSHGYKPQVRIPAGYQEEIRNSQGGLAVEQVIKGGGGLSLAGDLQAEPGRHLLEMI